LTQARLIYLLVLAASLAAFLAIALPDGVADGHG
jgi:hypothetical protein